MAVLWSILAFIFVVICIGILLMRYKMNGGLYRRYCTHITTKLHGKTVVITGGNAGIGKITAIDFARRGAKVIIGCRNPKKAEAAVKEIKRCSGSDNVVYRPLELSDQDSVRTFADTILKEETRIDFLINNAGIIMSAPGQLTKEGYNMVFAVNHFGPFLLTMLLLDRLKESAPSRIVNLSSCLHTRVLQGDMNFALKDDAGRIYPGLREYDRSKLANLLFTKELARKLEGTEVTTYAVHPGTIRSSLFDTAHEVKGEKGNSVLLGIVKVFFYLVGSDEEAGAQTSIYCALEESIKTLSGSYFDNCCLTKESDLGRDEGLAKKLWEVSCQATGL